MESPIAMQRWSHLSRECSTVLAFRFTKLGPSTMTFNQRVSPTSSAQIRWERGWQPEILACTDSSLVARTSHLHWANRSGHRQKRPPRVFDRRTARSVGWSRRAAIGPLFSNYPDKKT